MASDLEQQSISFGAVTAGNSSAIIGGPGTRQHRVRSFSEYTTEKPHDIVRILIDAIDLANTAIDYENHQGDKSTLLAIDYFDKAVLSIDEVLSYLDPQSSQWKSLYAYRCKYDERIVYLQNHLNQHYDFSLPSVITGSMSSNSSSHSSHNSNHNNSSNSSNSNSNSNSNAKISKLFYDFEKDLISQNPSLNSQYNMEKLPQKDPLNNPALMPYYQLRSIKKIIESGGFLTDDLFIPSMVWTQNGVKFSGLSIKTSAYQSIIVLISEQIATLQLSEGQSGGMRADSMNLAINAFKITRENLRIIQNQLSKPFSYIKECAADDQPLSPKSPTKSHVSRWTGMISSFSKNMIKYAEVGYSRLGTLPTRISEEDLVAFATLTAQLCTQCQLFEKWFIYVINVLSKSSSSNDDNSNTSSSNQRNNSNEDKEDQESSNCNDFEIIYQEIVAISAMIKNCIVESMLQDTETLLQGYLAKTTKRFCKIDADEEADQELRNSMAISMQDL